MNSWFYAHNGEQKGPVSQEELVRLASAGEFTPAHDLVWREGMSDWKKVSEIPELNLNPPSAATQPAQTTVARSDAATDDPYKAPAASSYISETTGEDDLVEIEPGSSPLGVRACIGRAFELTKRYFGILLAVWAIYIGISMGINMVFSVISTMFIGISGAAQGTSDTGPIAYYVLQIVSQIVSQIVAIFFTLGLARFGLNLISGRAAEVSHIFSQGSKLLPGFFASILVQLIAYLIPALLALGGFLIARDPIHAAIGGGIGLIPAIYFGIKYSQFLTAMVDRDLGILESLSYSAALTQNNKWAILGFYLLTFLITLGGMLALCIGLIFAIPLTWLGSLLVYRWLKYGPAGMEERGLLRMARM